MPKAVLRRGKTIWLGPGARQPHPKPPRYPTLRGHHVTEIAIVGGGMTGAMLAEAFTAASADVIVAEAARVGHGSTAASTALLLQEPDYDLEALSRKYGAKRGRRIWELSRDAARDFIETIRRLRIDCDLREIDSLYYTLDAGRAKLLQRELRRRTAARLGGSWMTLACWSASPDFAAPEQFAHAATHG